MLAIKLERIGKKHQAAFRLIVDEKKHRLGGKKVEDLGWYNPRSDKFELKKERVQYWIKVGAKPTDTAHNLLIGAGIIEGKKIPVHKQPKKTKDAAKEASGEAIKAVPAVAPETTSVEVPKIEEKPASA